MNKSVLEERKVSISDRCENGRKISCERESVSGAVSQRACVYCGARVVLNPITDAYHIVHGPIGCASYTWDIRGSLTSGADTFRNSFSTDLRETDIVFGGVKKLTAAIDELMEKANPAPKLIFVFGTCIVGVIGDDIDAVCRAAEAKYGIRVIPVKAPGFSGTKSLGYRLACDAIMTLIRPYANQPKKFGVNFLGDYNLAAEAWIIKGYLEEIGIPVIATISGDSSHKSLTQAPSAMLNMVQCAGSSAYLASRMEDEFGIPSVRVSFFGIEDTTASLLRVADALKNISEKFNNENVHQENYNQENVHQTNEHYANDHKTNDNQTSNHQKNKTDISQRAREFAARKTAEVLPIINKYKPRLQGKKAAIFVGGGFKAISLIRQFNELGIETVVVGTQTGKKDEYDIIGSLVNSGTVVLDDANPAELERFMTERGADILVGGVKERPLAYKLGMAFCDHNHERKHPLAGFVGIENFVKEIHRTINSPVWNYVRGDAA